MSMATQILEHRVEGASGDAAVARRRVGKALDSLDHQTRALSTFSLVEGNPTRCGQAKAHNFIADKRMSPPVFH
jgi:hypothetical protein